MEERKVKKAIEILERSKKEEILSLTDETYKVILEKHPKASKASSERLLDKGFQDVHPVIYDRINSDMVREDLKKTRC